MSYWLVKKVHDGWHAALVGTAHELHFPDRERLDASIEAYAVQKAARGEDVPTHVEEAAEPAAAPAEAGPAPVDPAPAQ